jgi:2-polyprenyl-3-methyl-5-hydroxy-6-metoxy-1,4-benzoquinol methylase
VSDPQALLQRAHALLRPGGVLWVAIPNPGSLGLRIFGTAWRGLHVPFHLCIPSQSQLRKWVESATFISIKTLRRGAHGRNPRLDSMAIADREKIATPPGFVTALFFILSDFLATFSPRWAEETVIVARKPGVADD